MAAFAFAFTLVFTVSVCMNQLIAASTQNKNTVPWVDARDNCVALGGDLASIHSDEENEAAIAAVGEGKRAYIGYNDRDSETLFQWSDGTIATYTNWGSSSHLEESNSNDCVAFDPCAKKGQWAAFPCRGYMRNQPDYRIGYLCKLPTTSNSSNSPYVYYSVEGDDKTDCDENIGLAAAILIIFFSICCCCSCIAGISFCCYAIFLADNKNKRIVVQGDGTQNYSNTNTVSSQNQFGTVVSSQNQFGTVVSSQNQFGTAVSSQNQFGNVNYHHANGEVGNGVVPQFAGLQHQPIVSATQVLPQDSSEQHTYVTAPQSQSNYRLAHYSV